MMVTESTAHIENAVQDFANAHYQSGKVILLVHGKENINKSIVGDNRFFAIVLSAGKLLYNRQFKASMLTARYSVQLAIMKEATAMRDMHQISKLRNLKSASFLIRFQHC